MKKILICVTFFICFSNLNSQEIKPPLYLIKAELIYGKIFKHTKHLQEIIKGPTLGAELDYEFLTHDARKDWQVFFNYPRVGIGAVYLNLGNDEILGNLLGLYPYLNFALIKSPYIQLNMKAGAGVSYLTKTFQDTKYYDENGTIILSKSNAAIGSHLNVYFAYGGNLEIPVSPMVKLVGELTWNHASNGSFFTPNSGLNMLNGSVGICLFPDYKKYYEPVKRKFDDLPRDFGMDIIFSGGAKQLDYRDNVMFPTGSAVINLHRNITNQLRLGIGMDVFYDGVYASVNSSANPVENVSKAKFTYLTSDKLINRFRGGISLQPELVFGRMSAGLHFGLYLFNPIKNLEPYEDAKSGLLDKPLIYAYDIEKENGWLYTRASFKYLINKHLFINIGLKTHLQKAEFIEWGLGYRL
jgi:hypothetical protein